MIFGRAMSKLEAKLLKSTGILNDSGSGLVPVFDAPRYVVKKLSAMSKDQLRNYFRSIGVRCVEVIAFFEAQPLIGPIPQKNGLIEYKIQEGSSVKPLYFIKC